MNPNVGLKRTTKAGVPALSSRTLSVPMDGSFAGTHSRASNAWNPETGIIASNNFIPQSETFNVAAWAKGTGVTTPSANRIVYAGGGVANQSIIYNTTSKLIPTGEKWALICYATALADSYFVLNTNVTGTSVTIPSGSTVTTVLPITGDGTNTHYAQLKATATNQNMDITAAFMFCRVDNITGIPWPYILTTTAAVYSPRYVSGKTGQAMLIEEASSQLLKYSDVFDSILSASAWANAQITVLSDSVANPFGFVTADTLTETATNNTHNLTQSVSVAATTAYTSSIYAKAGTRQRIQFREASATGAGSTFDLSAGSVVLDENGGVGKITSMGNGWYRCAVTWTSTTSGARVMEWYLMQDNGSGNANKSYAGNTGKYLYVDLAQTEALPYATSPIVSGATVPVTRAADVVTYPTAGVLTAAQGTISLWVKVDAAIQAAATLHHLVYHTTGGGNDLIRILKNGADTWNFNVSNAAGALTGGSVALTLPAGWNHIVLCWSAAGTYGYANAVEVVADITAVTVPAALAATFTIGNRVDNVQTADMPIDNLNIWSTVLTPAQILQAYRSGR